MKAVPTRAGLTSWVICDDEMPYAHLDMVIRTSFSGGPWREVFYPGALYRGVGPRRHQEIPIWPDDFLKE